MKQVNKSENQKKSAGKNIGTAQGKNGTSSSTDSNKKDVVARVKPEAGMSSKQEITTNNQQDPQSGNKENASNIDSSSGKNHNGESKLEKFFVEQLKDIYYAEKKILSSLPKMQQSATTEELKEAFEDHQHQTERHIKRLEKVFQILGKKPEAKKCEAIEGITKEADEIITATEEGTMTRDAALIMAAQKVEHYEIASYGGLVQFAITMGLEEVADLLDKTLVEEEDTDQLLAEIAENNVNLGAEQEENEYSWDKEEAETGATA